MNEVVDLLFAGATFIFSMAVLYQIYKNYKIKKVTSQSSLWHIATVLGLCLILLGHIVGGFWLSVFITIFNMIERITLIIQIKIYWVDDSQ